MMRQQRVLFLFPAVSPAAPVLEVCEGGSEIKDSAPLSPHTWLRFAELQGDKTTGDPDK